MKKLWSRLDRWDRFLVIALGFGIIAFAALGVPAWISFVAQDNATTCYDARYWTCVRYQMAVRDALESGAGEEEIDYEQLLRDVVSENFQYTLKEDLTSEDLCRQKGSCIFVIDEGTHGLTIVCSEEGHLLCDDADLTGEDLDKVTW